jgi:hypothetical protein
VADGVFLAEVLGLDDDVAHKKSIFEPGSLGSLGGVVFEYSLGTLLPVLIG